MPETRRRCAHEACSCLAPEDGKFCSQYCSDAADTTEIACNCGHPGCAVEELEVPLESDVA